MKSNLLDFLILQRNLFWPGHRKWAPYNCQPKHPYPRSKKERNKETNKQTNKQTEKTYISVTVLSQTCWSFWTLKGIFFGPEMTSIHPPRATAAIENELLSIASQVQVWSANWNVNDRSIFVLTLTLQSTRTLSSPQGLLPGFLAVWLPPAIWLAGLSSDSMPYASMVSLPTLISNAEYRVKNQ